VAAPTIPEGVAPFPTAREVDVPAPTALEKEAERPTSPPATAARLPTTRISEWRPGEVLFGLYEVIGELGKGGMGRVYKVRHPGWDLDLAAKVPLPSLLEAAGGADLFEQEAETWVNLGLHPHTVTCYYVRRLDGLPVVFAEFVNGGSLHGWIRDESRLGTLEAILDVAIQFAWGLHYAHEQGLVHLDVKPANVMLTSEGLVKVTDFGLARARPSGVGGLAGAAAGGDAGQTLTVDGALGGTPAYISPEQAEGGTLTRRADLWSWALSVLEMFEGERFWEYGPAAPEALEGYLQGERIAERPMMPEPVVELLRTCFRKEPDARPHTLADAAESLGKVYESVAGRPYPRRMPRTGHGTPDSLNNRAVSLLDLGREAEAVSLWRRALEAQPHHVEATYNEALSGWVDGRWDDDEMLRRMGEARTTHARVARVHHLLGRLHLWLGDTKRAIPSLEEATRLGRSEVDLERDLGLAALAANDPELTTGALERFRQIVDGGSAEAVDYVGRAYSLLRVGEEKDERGKEEAQHFYRLAVAQKPDLPPDLDSALRLFLPGHHARVSLKGLSGTVAALALTPDGTMVLAGSGKEVRTWDVHGLGVRTLTSEEAVVRRVAVTPDSRFLIWAGENAPVQVWDLFSGRPVRHWQRQTGLTTALALASDGRHAVTGSSDRQVRLWDLATGQCLRVMEGHEEVVTSVAVGGRCAVSGSQDGTVRVWDLAGGRALAVLQGHEGPVNAVALSEEDARVVSGGEDHTIRDWGLNSGELVRGYFGHTKAVTALALGGKGVLFTGGADSTVRAWDLERGQLRSVARLDKAVTTLALAPDGTLWVAHGSHVSGLPPLDRPRLPPFAHARPVSAVEAERHVTTFDERVEEAGRALAEGDHARALDLLRTARAIPGYERAEAAVTLWDAICAQLPRAGLRSAWEEATLEGHTDQVLAVAVSPDGERAASSGMDRSVRLWDLGTRSAAATLGGHEEAASAVAFSRDGRRVASGSWDRTVRLWDAASGALLRTLEGHEEYVTGVDLAPDGAWAASGSWDQTVRLWALAGANAPAVLAGHASNVAGVCFSPDGRIVVSGAWDQTVRAWDAAAGECVCVFEGHEGNVTCVAFSPTGRQVASGGADTRVRIWDPRTRRAARVLSGHTGEVTAIAFAPDGRYLASAGRDKAVRIWDLQKGTCERTLTHPDDVLGLAFTPAGNVLLTGGADRTMRTWHLDWEPEARAGLAWDEKARPFLETFVSLRLKPGAARAATARAWSEGEVDGLIADLRQRGFGGLRREAVVGKLEQLGASPEAAPAFWEQVRRSAPKVPRAAPAVTRLPWGRWAKRSLLTAAALAAIVVGVRSWMKPKEELRLIPYMAKTVNKEVDLIRLDSFDQPCDLTYDAYRERARTGEPSGPELKCLAGFRQRGTVTDYLAEAPLADEQDPRRGLRLFRNAVSLMVGLGEVAVEPLCAALADPRPEARRVAAVSLARMAHPSATACLRASLGQDYGVVRVTAASVVRMLLANGQLEVVDGWALVNGLLRDPEPAVRMEGLRTLAMFSADMATAAASGLLADPDPEVARAAKEAVDNIAAIRKIDLLRAGS
jgi:WD40 repeat protein/serine/threonine protein kinase